MTAGDIYTAMIVATVCIYEAVKRGGDVRKCDRFWAIEEARERVRKAEADGEVVDSMEVRRALMARVSSGETTIERAQEELKKIKRTGRTRNDAFLGKP